ncbi:putative HVA22-like protein g [Hypsizygus marmoreus]|uniref:Protein YOP1 n=1 Tax=Hypsizygus marmoreus TaxID=39966 RepID=A0A369KCF4_HYPMA|nr:putative HVA22-like protein g [Hypsizygus marmoreus]
MFMSLLSHAISAWFAFLLPSFATFKALSHRPLSEPELQRWSMYWAVVGAFVGFEYLGEWLISWFPFYWEVKTLFLLFLALPQTEGSTYIYITYLQPFLAEHESELDAGIVSIQSNILAFLKAHFLSLWEVVSNNLNKAAATDLPPASEAGQEGASTGTYPWSLPTVLGFWRTYGSSLTSMIQPPASARSAEPIARSNEKEPNASTGGSLRSGSPSTTPPAVPGTTE